MVDSIGLLEEVHIDTHVLAELGQGLDILWKTGAAVTEPRAQEILPDIAADLFDQLQQAADCMDYEAIEELMPQIDQCIKAAAQAIKG